MQGVTGISCATLECRGADGADYGGQVPGMRFTLDARFIEWEGRQHPALTADPLWRLDAYRLAVYAADAARADLRRCGPGTVPPRVRDQLLSAANSIPANIAEGHSRPTPPDRARFYSYALGSTRETIRWYAAIRGSLGDPETFRRFELLAHIRRLLIGIVRANQRISTGARFRP